MKPQKKSVKNHIYDNVLQDILQGNYSAQTVITEPTLIQKYNVSKTSVREALVNLCAEGILRNVPRFGYQLVQLTAGEVSAILDTRRLLELGALEKTITIISKAELTELETTFTEKIDIMIAANIFASWKKNMDFHLQLCSYCRNPFIYTYLNQVFKLCSLGANQSLLQTWGKNHTKRNSTHRDLIECLHNKDLKKAQKILTCDILSMKNEWLNN